MLTKEKSEGLSSAAIEMLGLRQVMADDIMEASDEEILAQFAEDIGSPDENAARMRTLFEKVALLANKGRLHAARLTTGETE